MNKNKKLIGVAVLILLLSMPSILEAKGGGGRGGGGGGRSSSRSSASRSVSSSKTTSVSKTISTPRAPKAPNISKPSTKTQTKVSSTAKTVNGKTYAKKGYVVGSGYRPRFNGYVPGAGDTVYYRSSPWDWFPLYYILTHDSHKEAVVVTASTTSQASTEKVVKEEGTDTMYIVNWIITILLGLGILVLIAYLLNRKK